MLNTTASTFSGASYVIAVASVASILSPSMTIAAAAPNLYYYLCCYFEFKLYIKIIGLLT